MTIGFLQSKNDPRSGIFEILTKKYEKDGWNVLVSDDHKNNSVASLPKVGREEILKHSDVVYSNENLSREELEKLKVGVVFISNLMPYAQPEIVDEFKELDINVFSLDMIPRTSLAQSMDVLSSMASLAGYKAVLLAAYRLPRYFPMLMTAAGTIKPASVLVVGAGVAGLQAIATAKKLGAKVFAFDVRTAVKDEVQSLGAKFIEVEGSKDDSSAGGYAVEQSDEYKLKQKVVLANAAKAADVIITTAQLRGKRAPILITKDMVEGMKKGSVIIDMASSTGGNCELTQDGVELCDNGVIIIGNSALHLEAEEHASEMLANNIYNFVKIFVKDGEVVVDLKNEIIEKSRIYSIQNN